MGPNSLDQLHEERYKWLRERLESHKSELDRRHDKLEGRVEAADGEIDKLKSWKTLMTGMWLIGGPLAGILTALLVHWMEKHF